VLSQVLNTIQEQQPNLLTGKRLQYYTDSQPGMAALMRMKGTANTFGIVKHTRLLSQALGTELEVLWRSRDHSQQRVADALTKVVDNNDWSLHPHVYSNLLQQAVLRGRRPTLDVFASPTNTKVPDAYYSLFLGPGCKGVDAFTQRWDADSLSQSTHLAFINGPFNMMGQILRKVGDQKVDCIIIAPEWPRPWEALWTSLPVRLSIPLPHRSDLFLPGGLVPASKRHPKAPRYLVKAYYVLWDK
jgi:hypothetical protein